MKNVERITEFYFQLEWFLSCGKFSKQSAETLVENYKKLKELISLDVDFSVEFLKNLHGTNFEDRLQDKDYDVWEKIAKAAFKDLAKNLRDPRASSVVDYFIETSGCDSNTDLFISKTNEKKLGNGYAVVTLVISSSEGLNQLLSLNVMKRNKIENVHLV
jgi:hypothetical protein